MLEGANIVTAFLAGLLSFFSPCALPLVPLFLGHLAGMTGDELAEAGPAARGLLLRNAAAFVAGFSLVFIVLFGLSAGIVGQSLLRHRDAILQIGGLFLIALGLNYLGLLRLPARWSGILRVPRPSYRPARRGYWPASLLVGATFALGWTPCIGAILGAIMVLAASGGDLVGAIVLLALYSLGLGLPFMVVAAGFGRVAPALQRINRYLPALNRLSGTLIIVVGAFMLVGAYQQLFVRLIRLTGWAPPL